MARAALLVLVALLACQMSGGVGLIMPDACAVDETAGARDDSCSAACIRCHCCAQPSFVVNVVQTAARSLAVTELHPVREFMPTANARKILHVPKRSA